MVRLQPVAPPAAAQNIKKIAMALTATPPPA